MNDMNQFVQACGSDVADEFRLPPDITTEEAEIFRAVSSFTLTGVERVVYLVRAIKYLVENSIAGDVVECGVWRGGSMMAVALALQRMGDTTRKLYLFDTFAGMSQPTEKDVRFDGVSAHHLIETVFKEPGAWCYADKQEVRKNLLSTGYPEEKFVLVEGRVEEAIPNALPSQICLLRLDTDWYESTKHELTHLYPRLVKNGVLIIDDYGHWLGSKQATDEFFNQLYLNPSFDWVDYSCRAMVKAE
jgi:hypothetical protein